MRLNVHSRKFGAAICLAALALVGCVNLGQFYVGASKEQIEKQYGRAVPPARVMYTSFDQLKETRHQLFENGYTLVGHSSFTGPSVDEFTVISFANELGVDLGVIGSQYSRTATGVIPFTTPSTSTTTSTFIGNIYGTGGSASIYGSGVSTTTGSTTSYVPFSVDHYSHEIGFFRKLDRPQGLGVLPWPPSDEDRRRAGTNQVMVIASVMRGSPAYAADIIRGDLLLQIGDIRIGNADDLRLAGERHAGQEVDIVLLRGNERISKRVRLEKIGR